MDGEWSKPDTDRLRDLWAQGLSLSKIGDALSRSKNAIAGKAHRLQLPVRGNPFAAPNQARQGRKPVPRDPRPPAPVRRAVAERKEAALPVVVVSPLAPSILPREPRTCCYIVGDPKKGGKACGGALFRGSWCEPHARACFATYQQKEA